MNDLKVSLKELFKQEVIRIELNVEEVHNGEYYKLITQVCIDNECVMERDSHIIIKNIF